METYSTGTVPSQANALRPLLSIEGVRPPPRSSDQNPVHNQPQASNFSFTLFFLAKLNLVTCMIALVRLRIEHVSSHASEFFLSNLCLLYVVISSEQM